MRWCVLVVWREIFFPRPHLKMCWFADIDEAIDRADELNYIARSQGTAERYYVASEAEWQAAQERMAV